jgi:hypothetical protein
MSGLLNSNGSQIAIPLAHLKLAKETKQEIVSMKQEITDLKSEMQDVNRSLRALVETQRQVRAPCQWLLLSHR